MGFLLSHVWMMEISRASPHSLSSGENFSCEVNNLIVEVFLQHGTAELFL